MASIYEARWANAVRIAEHINALLKEGWAIFDEEGERVTLLFEIDEDLILQSEGNCRYWIFIRDTEEDSGMHTPVKEYTAQYDKWTAIPPNSNMPLFKAKVANVLGRLKS